MGQTLGTEFGKGFELADVLGVMDRWNSEGHMHERSMQSDDLGQAIVELLTQATLFALAEVDKLQL